jgi:hypothetical protein
LRSTAHESIEEMYLSRLFAAPGLSALRSRSMRMWAADSRDSGHNASLSGEVGLTGSRKQASMIPRRFDCDAGGRRVNSTDAK